jgi:Zn-finger nucleic acid-binding protein
MECPRCQSTLTTHDVPGPEGGTAWVKRCTTGRQCGVWYQEADLAALHPQFADAQVRAALVTAPRDGAAPPVPCPYCGDGRALAAVRFVGVTLDVCEYCHGVWVDLDEYATLMHALRTHVTGVAFAPGPYRSVPTTAAMTRQDGQWARCVRCGGEAPYAEVLFTDRGFMCFACGSAYAREG